MFLSVIIPTMNRIQYLRDVVESLNNQTLDKSRYELIIMDESSDLSVKDFVSSLTSQYDLDIKYFFHDIPGNHVGRNSGVKKAKGDIIIFLDDDVKVTENYLKSIYQSFAKDPEIALMTGRVLPLYEKEEIPDWLGYFWKTLDGANYIWEISLMDAGNNFRKINSNLIFGCNFIVRKDIYYFYGGTYPDIFSKKNIKYSGSAETLFANKIENDGLKVFYNPEAAVYHRVTPERLTPGYFYRRNFIMGIQHSYDDIRKTKKRFPLKQVLRDFYILFKSILKIILRFYSKPERINFICALNKFKGRMQHKLWVLMDRKLFEFIIRDNYFEDGKEFI